MNYKSANKSLLLAGDIGATKTTLAIFNSSANLRNPVIETTYKSKSYKTFYDVLSTFIKQVKQPIQAVSIGVAGPVLNNSVKTTNLTWEINQEQLTGLLNTDKILLINDLVATAHSISLIDQEELYVLNQGNPTVHSNIAIIAPGTGLGESFLVWDGTKYLPQPSEGGNSDFAPNNSLQFELYQYLKKKYNHITIEMVCSGRGISHIYQFLKNKNPSAEPDSLTEQLTQYDDHTPLIVQEALKKDKPCELCNKTIQLFLSILGGEAGNLALRVLSTNGIYIGGGILPRIIPLLQDDTFSKAFQNKGGFINILKDIPIRIILNTKAPLIGAAHLGYINFFKE